MTFDTDIDVGEDLGYRQGVVEKAKFEYSPLGNTFNKGLDESDEKERLLKRLKNIEDKNEEQIKACNDQGKGESEKIKKIVKQNLLSV